MPIGYHAGRAIELTPSILSANFANLGADVQAADEVGCSWIQVDVMDGHFVPNLTFGPPVIKAIRPYFKGTLDVHLMVSNPDALLEEYAAAGANHITVHQEASVHLHRTIQRIHELGCTAGVALNPATPVSSLEDILEDLDLVLIMSVNPGFGGQIFIERSLAKIAAVRSLLDQRKHEAVIQVDGGVKPSNIAQIVQAGATNLIAGSAFYSANITPHQAWDAFVAALA
ncbi:ribulose-phosphate 3-epimerase [Herpetosiphon giganteus]|uniref:ribulose-phosphate 3-epimerase n=1 Tax=Herpetosiphon giganteus TaxID=2029754 RepID=UPI0019587CEB|nr:ribulose-phosphate 3-epimerase [Herpetosiphon giganteus]MBM7845484.1 ribulose-phosphate 3-epimerase [Herpetosiphon giganteus]